jgi:hypothetical protein
VTYAGGFVFDESERAALSNALESVSPTKKGQEQSMSVMLNTYSMFTEEELKAMFTNEKGELNVYGYNTAKAQTQDQFSTMGNFVKTGESAIFFVSPMVYEELNLKKPVWVELGLQTANERTAQSIRRHYTNDVYIAAVQELRRR